MDILDQIARTILPGCVIPKPEARGDFIVKGWGMRRGARALIYTIPNHKTPESPYKKGITVYEWRHAFLQLTETGNLSRSWFDRLMPECAKDGGCNFTTIGGVFMLLGYASHERGIYRLSQVGAEADAK